MDMLIMKPTQKSIVRQSPLGFRGHLQTNCLTKQPARSLGSSAAGACMCKITVQKETVYLTAGTNSHIQGLVFSPLSYPQPCFLNNCGKIHVTVTHFKCTISTFQYAQKQFSHISYIDRIWKVAVYNNFNVSTTCYTRIFQWHIQFQTRDASSAARVKR